MKNRFLAALAILLMVVACAPEPATETEPAAEPETESAEMDEATPVDAVREAYVRHYNAGDAEALAELFTEDAVTLYAGGGVQMGREAITAGHAATLASGPTAQIDSLGSKMMGDLAVDHGHYEVVTTLESGESVSFGGSYMSMLRNVDGEWKLGAVTSNYDAEPPEGMPAPSPPERPEEAPADNPLADALAAYEDAFNAGDAAAVAALYTEDAWAAWAGREPAEGREAIEAGLAERMATGSPQLDVHLVAVEDMGDGWYGGGGWTEITSGDTTVGNNWMGLFRTAEDGSIQLHWVVTNNVPLDGM